MGSVASIISAASSGALTGLSYGQRQQDAQAASLRGRFENDVAERNAQLAERQGRDTVNRGALEEDRQRLETRQSIGSARAAAAASGVDVSSGSGAAVAATQSLLGDLDALTIRNDAARQAWGYDVEAANSRTQGRLALLSGENEAATHRAASVSTLLTGATSMYNQFSGMRASKSGSPTSAPAFKAGTIKPGWK